MNGMNAHTGRAISGADHLNQSIEIILSTPLATRLKRRPFGSELPDLVDAAGNRATLVRVYAAVATALMRWEPRLTVTKVAFDVDAMASGDFRAGRVPVVVEGYAALNGARVELRTTVDANGLTAGVTA
ncbi:MAG: GPW/gp25 family protein [Burkholderia gladioli]